MYKIVIGRNVYYAEGADAAGEMWCKLMDFLEMTDSHGDCYIMDCSTGEIMEEIED